MNMDEQPLISVVVVNWNGKVLLKDCLSSLLCQTYQNIEIILIDNNSSDGSVEWVKDNYCDIKIVELDQNYGFCKGNNIGISESKGDYVALLNNDTEVEPDWLEQLYTFMKANKRIAACDSKVYYFDDRKLIWSAGAEYSVSGAVNARGYRKVDDRECFVEPKDVFAAVACAVLYRRSALQDVGLFDEDFFAGYEDIDWSYRARLLGYEIYNIPTSIVYHKVSSTQIVNSHTYVFRGQRNVEYVFWKNMPALLLFLYFPLHILYNVGSLIYFYRIGRLGPFIEAKLEFLKKISITMAKRKTIQNTKRVRSYLIHNKLSKKWLGIKIRKLMGNA